MQTLYNQNLKQLKKKKKYFIYFYDDYYINITVL